MNFENYFENIKNANLIEKFRGVKYFGPFRGDYAIRTDSTFITFNLNKKNFSYDTNSVVLLEGKKNNLYNLIDTVLRESKNYKITSFEFKDSSYVTFFFDLDIIEPKTIPSYEPPDSINNNKESREGLLVYLFNNITPYNFRYYKPTEIDKNWYFYSKIKDKR